MKTDEIDEEYKAAGVAATAAYLEGRMSWYDWNVMHNARLSVYRSRLLERRNSEICASEKYVDETSEAPE